jgi:hypothetical protein
MTTDKLLKKLEKIGLTVSRNMLAQDVKKGYLPAPKRLGKGAGKGVSGLRDDRAVRQAVHLYRLRSRGVTGELLRVFLFLRDGWGWEEVKQICIDGLRKLILIQSSPVRKHLRKPEPRNVEFCLADIVEETDINPTTARFVYGVGLFGKPLAGGSLQHLFSTFHKVFASSSNDSDKRFLELMVSCVEHVTVGLGLSWQEMEKLVETADNTKANKARIILRQQFVELRRIQRVYNVQKDITGVSTNIRTFFGKSEKELARLFRKLPQRVTTAQFLAFCLAPAFALELMAQQTSEALSEISPNIIALVESQGKSEPEPDKLLQEAHQLMDALKDQADSEDQLKALEMLRSMFDELESAMSKSKKE